VLPDRLGKACAIDQGQQLRKATGELLP
jgi:hypothetical protein